MSELDFPYHFDGRGRTAGSSTEKHIRDLIEQVLLTSPGERVMRPDYGCYLHRLMFAPNDDTTAGLAIHYVRSAVERWEPRIEIQRLDAGAHPEEPGQLDIMLDYRIRATGHDERLTVAVGLAG